VKVLDSATPCANMGLRVLVTCGAQGIGLAISSLLLRSGHDVFVSFLSSSAGAAELSDLAVSLGRKFGSARADLTLSRECEALVATAAGALGGLDVLVNNCGSLVARKSLAASDDAFWADVMAINVSSAVATSRAATPHLVAAAGGPGGPGASIVNISSCAGRKGGHAGSIAYSTAKGAMLTFTRSLASELGPSGVRVNAVAPGFIQGTSFHATHTTPESAAATIAALPLQRAGRPEDVARVVLFLAGEGAGFITGATLDVNGGQYMV
jgi:3-oxoacyl-[acyl-carrier protein] reductase